MTINQIYALPGEQVKEPLEALGGCYFNHFSEVDNVQYLTGNTRVSVTLVKDHCYDGRRIWRLGYVSLDGKPFMVIQNAGREGDDHDARFISDKALFWECVAYLRSLANSDDDDVTWYSPDEDIPSLTRFYSDTLEMVGQP